MASWTDLNKIRMHLQQAARSGDLKEAREEIDEIRREFGDNIEKLRYNLGAKDQYGLTALHYAVKYNHFEIVKLLVENKIDVNVAGNNGQTPIHYVTCFTRGSDASILQYLIRNGADVNSMDEFQCTPLHNACNKGNVRVVKELMTASGIEIEPKDQLKNTPLHNACSVGSIDIVDILLGHGADVLCENDAKCTPLHIACGQGHEDLLNHLLQIVENKHGIGKLACILEQKNSEGQTLLHLAVLGSHLSITKNLLERGCNVNSAMDGEETCLHIAAITGNKEIVELLLRFMPDTNVDIPNEAGRTALHKAARFGKFNVVSLLLERGADVNYKDNEGISPLILASTISGNPETIQILLDHDADLLVTDKEDQTALHTATIENNIEGVKTLLNSNQIEEIIDSKDKDSNTCLHISCAMGFEEIAIVLMEKCANVKSRNNEDKTPLHAAALHGQDNVVDNIIEINSSTINDTDKDGNSPLHLAAQNGHSDVIKYLLKCGAAVDDKNAKGLTPVDCAASSGHTDAVKALLWGGASVDPNEETGFTPLHFSCIAGHVETSEFLLEYCDVGSTEMRGKNPMDLAIDNLHEDVATAILDHRDWKRSLRNKTFEDGQLMTPIRKMIKRMPDVAHYAFTRCICDTDEHPKDHAKYTISMTYEFIDDIYNKWPCDDVYMETKDQGRKKIPDQQLQRIMESKETHTLSHMIEHHRQELLLHPLVKACIEKKWEKFAAYLFYFKLILYTFFLIFLTGYTLMTAPMREPYRAHDCTITYQDGKWEITLFVHFGKFAVLLLALLHLLFEIFQIIGQRMDYFEIDNLLEWAIYLLAIANVIDDFITIPFLEDGLVCGVYQKTIGATCLFLAWLNFVLFIRKVSVFGIYIVMFLYVIKTFFRFFAVFVFLIAAFGFSFCVLLQDQSDLPAFHNPFAAMIKTGVMMTGEMGFDDIFFSDNYDADIALWIIFIIFVLIMNIVLMNLLVGLAVDDIQAVQKEAEMTKATMQIEICLDSERTLPKRLRREFIVKDQILYVNNEEIPLPSNVTEETFLQIKELVQEEKEPIDQLQDNLKSLNTNVSKLDKRVEDMDEQVSEIATLNAKIDHLQLMIKEVLKYQKRRRKHRTTTEDKKDSKKKGDNVVEGDDTGTGDDDIGSVDGVGHSKV